MGNLLKTNLLVREAGRRAFYRMDGRGANTPCAATEHQHNLVLSGPANPGYAFNP